MMRLLKPAVLAVTLAASLAAAASPLAAQTQQSAPARETPPPPGEPRELKLPAIETYRLANGMQVTMIPFGSVPKVTLSLRIRAGAFARSEERRVGTNCASPGHSA